MADDDCNRQGRPCAPQNCGERRQLGRLWPARADVPDRTRLLEGLPRLMQPVSAFHPSLRPTLNALRCEEPQIPPLAADLRETRKTPADGSRNHRDDEVAHE